MGQEPAFRERSTGFHDRLDATKTFLESLQAYTTPAKLKNFRHEAPDVIEHRTGLDALDRIRSIETLRTDIDATAAFLSAAEAGLPDGHEWVGSVKTAQHEVLAEFNDPSKRDDATFRQRTTRRLEELKDDYVRSYLALHTKSRLGVDGEKSRNELMQDPRVEVAAPAVRHRVHAPPACCRLPGTHQRVGELRCAHRAGSSRQAGLPLTAVSSPARYPPRCRRKRF